MQYIEKNDTVDLKTDLIFTQISSYDSEPII